MPTLATVTFRIRAAELNFYVDVGLRNFDGRWLAVADIAGEHDIGLGRSAQEALAASLSSLGTAAATALMADPQLLHVGRQDLNV